MEKGIKWRWKKISKKTKVIISMAALVLVGGTTGGILFFRGTSAHAMGNASMVQTAKAERGSILNTVTGTGNLELDTAKEIEIPSSILIDQVLVESGDHVSAGDVLATVDATSVLSALQEIQDSIGELDEEINDKKDDVMDDVVQTQVSGRIKKIYVESGDSVSSVMVENGALMLMSVGGKMSVALSGVSGAAVGDTVNVNLSDGSVEEGTVESLSGGNCVVTLTDDGTAFGVSVSVTAEDGTELGTGTLGIHQQLSIMGTAGTVSSVSVSENESVSSGETLLNLTDVPAATEYQELLAERENTAETMQKLLKLSQSGNITAEMDGTLQSVNISSNTSSNSSDASATDSDSSVTASGKTAAKTSTRALTNPSGNEVYTGNTASLLQYQSAAALTADDSDITMEKSTTPGGTEDLQGEENGEAAEGSLLDIQIGSSSAAEGANVMVTAPETDGQSQTSISTDAASGFTGIISWSPSDGTFHESTVYQATIVLTADDGYYFGASSITKLEIGTVSGIAVSADGQTLNFTITFPKTKAKQEDTGKSESDETAGTGTINNNGTSSTQKASASGSSSSGTSGGSGGSGSAVSASNISSGSSSSGSSTSSTSDSSSSSSSQDSTDVTAFTISSDENVILSVNVDELDINSIALGQEAEVTFDAIEDASFVGQITSIGNSASASGGVAKYAVSVTVPKDEQMKVGMNASAVITIESKEDVITIPMNALQERGESVFVYTSKDEEGNLSGEVEVTTGLSDGSTVEITEGLSEGDTVYYQKTGSSDTSSQGMPDFGGMGGGTMPDFGGGDSGTRPSGGGSKGSGQAGGGPGGQ